MTTTMSGTVGQVDAVRKPTEDDAKVLGQVRLDLVGKDKIWRSLLGKLEQQIAPSGNLGEDFTDAIVKAKEAFNAYVDGLIPGREKIEALPRGTTAPGGANRQSIVVECFGTVDSTLGAVMTATEAKEANARSFGKVVLR